MKVELSKPVREIFRVLGSQGGKAGSREKKRQAARARWARVRQSKELSGASLK